MENVRIGKIELQRHQIQNITTLLKATVQAMPHPSLPALRPHSVLMHHPLAQVLPPGAPGQLRTAAAGSAPPRSVQQQQQRTQVRGEKDVVTAVTHQDVNGVSAVTNTVTLKDIDVQMTALSGYETYV